MKTKLTPEMEKYFVENAFNESVKSMALKFGVSDSVVDRAFRINNIKVPREIQRSFATEPRKYKFTFEEDCYIVSNLMKSSQKSIAKDLGISSSLILRRCKELGLETLVEFNKKRSQLKKGAIPPNKGKKQHEFLSKKGLKAVRKTQFKKGQTPHNAKKPFEEVLREDKNGNPYWMIKLPSAKRMVNKHVWLWESKYGKVKKGFVVVFKDGDTINNCTIENLECISRQELMLRNSRKHDYPKELIPEYAKISLLKSLIKEKS